ncbi:MAG: glucosamine--fructose-6-phosphate aminotransferase [Gammaproteobacteria bacterium]
MTRNAVPRLTETMRAGASGSFARTLKRELESLPAGCLPLQEAAVHCGIIDDSNISVTVIRTSQNTTRLQATVGVFFTEIVAGCVCGEDPSPVNAYCEIRVGIDRTTADVDFELIQP